MEITKFAAVDKDLQSVYGVGSTRRSALKAAEEWVENSENIEVVDCTELAYHEIQSEGFTNQIIAYVDNIGIVCFSKSEE